MPHFRSKGGNVFRVMKVSGPIYYLIPLVALGLSAGCSKSADLNYQSARLEGEVTVDGQPIEDGTVQFVPANLADGPITQASIMKGRYVAAKVPLGKVTAILHANPRPRPRKSRAIIILPRRSAFPAATSPASPSKSRKTRPTKTSR